MLVGATGPVSHTLELDDPGAVGAALSLRTEVRSLAGLEPDDRARRRGALDGGEKITLREIAERDGWKCHLCGEHVEDQPYDYRASDGTLDHLIPVADGGTHTRDNVRLAHMGCNAKRNTGGEVQLLLFG